MAIQQADDFETEALSLFNGIKNENTVVAGHESELLIVS